jgi:ectoine hydroxylase-related dioxygenase (phytanoyl-CoA dioxygenase family)
VVWIPLEKIDEGTGGIELMSMACSGDKVYKTTLGKSYNSYADAIKLAEALPSCPIIDAPMDAGDVLIFKFNILHRSKPVVAKDRSRFTMQLRFVDLADPQFISNSYKPATVSVASVDLMKNGN